MQDLVIIGAGPFGEEMLDNLRLINEEEPRWNLLGFIDEEATGEIDGIKVLGKLEDFLQMDRRIQFFVADMDGFVRQKIATICKAAGFTGATITDNLKMQANVHIGEGCFLGYKCHLSTSVTLGDFCVFERGCIIGHDTEIGSYSTFRASASLGGDSVIGQHTTLGLRCTMINLVNTPDHCDFAAGSCVIKHTTVPGYYEGVPAKLVRAYND